MLFKINNVKFGSKDTNLSEKLQPFGLFFHHSFYFPRLGALFFVAGEKQDSLL